MDDRSKRGPRIGRSVALVAGGTAAAQVLTAAATPVLTRLFGPEALGALATVLAYTGVLGPVAGLCLPIAIVIAKEHEVGALARLARLTALGVGVLAATASPLFLRGAYGAGVPWVVLIGAVFVLTTSSVSVQIAQQQIIRSQNFALLGMLTLGQALLFACLQIGAGSIRPDALALILVSSSYWILFLLLTRLTPKYQLLQSTARRSSSALRTTLRTFSDFPTYRAPQVLVNVAGAHAPTLLLASLVDLRYAGFYMVTHRIMAVPVQLAGKAISDVIYPQMSHMKKTSQSAGGLLVRWTLISTTVSIPIALSLIFVGDQAFSFVLGSEWAPSAVLAQALIPWMVGALMCRPAVGAVPVLGLQRAYLLSDLVVTSVKTVGFYLLLVNGVAVWVALLIWSTVSLVGSLWITLIALRRAGAWHSH